MIQRIIFRQQLPQPYLSFLPSRKNVLVLVFQLFLLSQSDICRRCLVCIFLCENIWLGSVYGILEANSGALRGGRLEGKGNPAGEPFWVPSKGLATELFNTGIIKLKKKRFIISHKTKIGGISPDCRSTSLLGYSASLIYICTMHKLLLANNWIYCIAMEVGATIL